MNRDELLQLSKTCAEIADGVAWECVWNEGENGTKWGHPMGRDLEYCVGKRIGVRTVAKARVDYEKNTCLILPTPAAAAGKYDLRQAAIRVVEALDEHKEWHDLKQAIADLDSAIKSTDASKPEPDDDGEAAFPCQEYHHTYPNGDVEHIPQKPGMSTRTWLAGMAMEGIHAGFSSTARSFPLPEGAAAAAVAAADATLVALARNKKGVMTNDRENALVRERDDLARQLASELRSWNALTNEISELKLANAMLVASNRKVGA